VRVGADQFNPDLVSHWTDAEQLTPMVRSENLNTAPWTPVIDERPLWSLRFDKQSKVVLRPPPMA
jgi:hypothetical protein